MKKLNSNSFLSDLNLDSPNFLDLQIKSFKDFIDPSASNKDKKKQLIYKVFSDNFPVVDAKNQFVLEFLDYTIEPCKYFMEECIERGVTYSMQLKVKFKLYCNDVEHEDFKEIIEDVYLGDIPYMTPSGSFIINGSERVIISQLHRSPGVFFSQSFHTNGTKLYSARIIPIKGSWIEFSTDINNVIYAYIDRKKKVLLTTLLRIMGFEKDKDILSTFGLSEEVKATKENLKKYIGRTLASPVIKSYYEDFLDEETGELTPIERSEIVLDRNTELEDKHIDEIIEIDDIEYVLFHKKDKNNLDYAVIYNTLDKDETNSEDEALKEIYRVLRSIDVDTVEEEVVRQTIKKMFFSGISYSLGYIGRYKINKKLGLNVDIDQQVLTKEDMISIIKYLIDMMNSKADIDDIDHLFNRRVKTVGEQLSDLFNVGINRITKTIRERMNIRDNEVFAPMDLINVKNLTLVLNSFFGTSQMCQFMDQTNLLSEITHKRRVTALGPGGLSRERAGFEVRDVHYTHYGRLCPIETPEGPNIGLISSLCIFAKVNSLGFIETPYVKVKKSKLLKNDVNYLTADEEEEFSIAQANAKVSDEGIFIDDKVKCRSRGDFPILKTDDIEYMDVSLNQIVSISASMIPFLEHDDANRALMGSNMMRQAVPLLNPELPIVSTGLEKKVVLDSNNMFASEGEGIVEYVDANKIVIKYEKSDEDRILEFESDTKTYNLKKFKKTNQNTVINLIPVVKRGDRVKKDQILCEGFGTKEGELSLGRNLLVAFMPWKGYNFEDAIVISDKVVREDIFTSIHVEEFSLETRDTKIGSEELTNDIPNVSEHATKDLEEDGVIRVGAEVKSGDILIGKITPRGTGDTSPEEKLLTAIFGEKAGNIKDSSKKAPSSIKGVVIDKKVFSVNVKDRKSRSKDKIFIDEHRDYHKKELDKVKSLLLDKLSVILKDKKSVRILSANDEEIVKNGTKLTKKIINNDIIKNLSNILDSDWTDEKDVNFKLNKLLNNYYFKVSNLDADLKRIEYSINIGDQLPIGVLSLAKVYVAKKMRLKVGDKMAGRHGNKGIVSKIARVEDMPFLEDGTPVDVVLNPLGVPSRMNLGQIYETVMGLIGKKMGVRFTTPIFDGYSIDKIKDLCNQYKIPGAGSFDLFDGGTGERFDQKVTVGIIYMLKLNHMVDDKMHARSVGSYSLITQQPLGGKSQFGGQRFGEMEFWALEAFGAANIIKELLTIKSDDTIGRSKAYESIVKGVEITDSNMPESFNVLLNELKGLCLNITLE